LTFFSNRSERPGNIDVGITYGPITIHVDEPAAYVRHFWGELGRRLDEIDADVKAAADVVDAEITDDEDDDDLAEEVGTQTF
jgi:hypothetical protein